jgi:uncharacterized protein YkwD
MSHRHLQLLFALTAAAALTACGGGGGSDASAAPTPSPPPASPVSPPPPTPTPVGTNGTLQSSVPAASYDARRKSAYDELNAARLGAGAGLLAQSAALDTSASSHAAYLTVNGFTSADSAHDETTGLPDFTGTDPFKRMQAAGYSFSFASEVIGDIGSSSPTSDCVGDLLDTIYHAADMLSRETDVGIGFGSGAAAGMCTIDLASALTNSSAQIPPSGAIVAYPYGGATVASGTFHVANESPRAPASLLPNATAGTPVLVGFRNEDYVKSGAATISQFTLADAGGNLVPSVILADSSVTGTNVNDDSNLDGGVVSGFAVLVPKSPLPAGNYTVTLHAAVSGGQALALTTWTFKVAAQ